MKYINPQPYRIIQESVPILCVDLVPINERGEFLLVKRKHNPMKGRWWTVGGRVFKGESITEAVIRKAKEELGVKVKILHHLGFYEELYERSELNIKGGVHTVTEVFLVAPVTKNIKLDETSEKYKWSKHLPPKLGNIQPFYSLIKPRRLLQEK